MSSILKALKKLEDENNARTPDSLRINAEILRGGDSARFSTLGIIVTSLLLFLCGGVATYLLMKPDGTKSATVPSLPPVERAVILPAVPVPPSPQKTPADVPQQLPAVLPQQVEKPKPSPVTDSTSSSKSVRNKPLPKLNSANHSLNSAPIHPPEQLESPIVSARPVVRVNGIAFQDGSDSVAVINGVAVSRGAVVEGVKVEEIQRDRVRFSYEGEKFEVSLGKSNQ